ncbi:hypothetical protein [Thermanaeromonas toyohensis]|uniref:hypothetical protein n=1 Tax=Thermanaeromonas toyohensis TaxID=161154 RepID=UPI0012F4EB2F|nr:hypothetical protein [Thermanaeromonas toyohensis]
MPLRASPWPRGQIGRSYVGQRGLNPDTVKGYRVEGTRVPGIVQRVLPGAGGLPARAGERV